MSARPWVTFNRNAAPLVCIGLRDGSRLGLSHMGKFPPSAGFERFGDDWYLTAFGWSLWFAAYRPPMTVGERGVW